jgi:hypothetical protein
MAGLLKVLQLQREAGQKSRFASCDFIIGLASTVRGFVLYKFYSLARTVGDAQPDIEKARF